MNMDLARRARSFLLDIPARGHGLKLFLAIVGAYLTSVSAHIAIPMPFTPVPITLQVFAIMLIAGLLGPFYGGLSQVIYVAAGLAGLPWYAGGAAGLNVGISGGYLAGFVAAGGLVGFLAYHEEFRTEQWKIGVAMLVGLVVIYIMGGFHFAMVTGSTYRQTLELAIMPFVLPDLVKVYFASRIVWWGRTRETTIRKRGL